VHKQHRFEFLDGLRGIAAFVVVVYHFTEQYGHAAFFSSAPLAVDLFFCLSGFVIAWSYYQRLLEGMSYVNYLKRRLIRLYPMFLMGLFVGLLSYLVKLHFGNTPYSPMQIAESNLFNIFYFPYFVNDATDKIHGIFLTNPPAWSLFFEMVANVLFLFTLRMSKIKLLTFTVFFAAMLVLSAYIFKIFPGWSTENFAGGFPRVGFSFMVGVLIFKFYDNLKKLPHIHPALIVAALLVMFLLPFHMSYLYWLFCTLFIVPFFIIAGANVQIKSTLVTKMTIFLGWLSYPIYCLHNPILNIYKGFTKDPINFYLEISIIFIVTIIVTYLIAKYYDDPLRARLNRQ
jgi:peptidoglycan/LPS O-acetylase OafA/YrhL